MKRLIIAALIAVTAALGLTSAPANAASGYVVTRIEWGGTLHRACRPGRHRLRLPRQPLRRLDGVHRVRLPGQLVGQDPVVGNNDWVSCTITINGRVEWTDYASLGDGHDANCLRVMNPDLYRAF
jgi:hypothetical protein